MNDNLNKVLLIGNVGDIKFINYDGGAKEFASLSLATSKYWYDNASNEKKSKTEWHRIVVYNENLVSILKRKQVSKGAKLFIEGALTNRKWVDQKGNNRVTTEIILQGYAANLLILPTGSKNYSSDSEFGHGGSKDEFDFGGNESKSSNYNNQAKKANSHNSNDDLGIDDFDNFLNNSDFNDEDDDKIPF
jgi:single-strand DNA-binding protein